MGNLNVVLILVHQVLTNERFGDLQERQAKLKDWINLVDNQDEYGCTAIHEAAANENYQILQMLLANGGDLYLKDSKG